MCKAWKVCIKIFGCKNGKTFGLKVLIEYWFWAQMRPIPGLVSFLCFIWDQDQYLSWHEFVNETNTKTCLDLKVLLRPRPIPGLDLPSLDFQYQYQESCWTPMFSETTNLVETKIKTCLDLNIFLRPRPIPGLDNPSLDFRDQYQESCWTLECTDLGVTY